MNGRAYLSSLAGRALRSVTPWTAALVGGLGIAAPILSGAVYELKFGRPSSTSGMAIPLAFIWGGLAAGVGGIVGAGVRDIVVRSRWAGPLDRRFAALAVILVIVVPSALAIQDVRRTEARNIPRVILSSHGMTFEPGDSALVPVRNATFLWGLSPAPQRGELRWNAQRVEVSVAADRLRLTADGRAVTDIDISAFDYAREAYGVPAELATTGRQWLALLVKLRTTGRRDLLFIFNAEGVLVHEELLGRLPGPAPPVGLATAGAPGGPQEFVVDRGVPRRYYLRAR